MHLGTTAQEWREFSDSERYAHIESLLGHFKKYIEYWLDQQKITGDCAIDLSIFSDVIRHYYHDLGRMSENIMSNTGNMAHPNDCKQKAIYAFWIRKLKPIKLSRPIEGVKGAAGNWINEVMAIFIVLTELDIIFGRKVATEEMDPDLYHDFLYFFRYKSVSPHALYLVLASLYL